MNQTKPNLFLSIISLIFIFSSCKEEKLEVMEALKTDNSTLVSITVNSDLEVDSIKKNTNNLFIIGYTDPETLEIIDSTFQLNTMDLNEDGIDDLDYSVINCSYPGSEGAIHLTGLNGCKLLSSNITNEILWPDLLTEGDTIPVSSPNWTDETLTHATFGCDNAYHGIGYTYPPSDTPKIYYLPFLIEKNDESRYGWIEIATENASGTTINVDRFAIEK